MKKNPAFPMHVQFFLPILESLQGLGGSASPSELKDALIEMMNISEEELEEKLKSGVARIDNKISWNKIYLTKGGFIDTSDPDVWSLTEKGLKVHLTEDDVLKIFKKIHSGFVTKKQPKTKQNEETESKDLEFALDGIDVHDLWDRSGSTSHGYTSPEDMAVEMMEEELDSFNNEVIRLCELNMQKEAKLYCMGVLKGIYKYAHESKSEFKDWAIDVPGECLGYVLDEWKKRSKNNTEIKEMNSFLKKECSRWA